MDTQTTRRVFVGGALAMPTMGILEAGASPADAKIFELYDHWRTLQPIEERLQDDLDAAHKRFYAMKVDAGAAEVRRNDWMATGCSVYLKGAYRQSNVPKIKASLAQHLKLFNEHGFNTQFKERCEEILASIPAYEARYKAAQEEAGIPAASDGMRKHLLKIEGVEKAIMAERARTFAGLQIKLALYQRYADEVAPLDEDYSDVILRSLTRDIAEVA